jgi:hypothetical protein
MKEEHIVGVHRISAMVADIGEYLILIGEIPSTLICHP